MSNSFWTMLQSTQGTRLITEAAFFLRAKRIEALANAFNVIADYPMLAKVRDDMAHLIVKATSEDL